MNISLGEVIAKRRKYLHLTQEDLANQINVSKSAIAKWETDGGIPDRDNIYRLAEVIGVSVEDMYHIISRNESENENINININITFDIIRLLESYGYKVSAPEHEEKDGRIKNKDSEKV